MWLDEDLCKEEEKPKIISHREARHSDLSKIRKLIQMNTLDMFGPIDCARIHEKASFSMVQLNENEEIISYVSLCTYPNVPSIPPNNWICWMHKHYGLDYVSSGNVMFIHFLAWDTKYTEEFFDKLLNAIFSSTSFCFYVILVHPPGIKPVAVIEENMTRVSPKSEQDSYKVQALYICMRYGQNPKLKMRLAVEEDNDDIVRIIDSDCTKIKDYYGEYYISEMIRYPDGQRQIIVGEIEGVVKGIMCITKVIDTELINEIFELDPYNGLLKYQDQDESRNGENRYRFLQGIENYGNPLKSKLKRDSKLKDKIFLCRCHEEKGEICTICFPDLINGKTSENSGKENLEVSKEEVIKKVTIGKKFESDEEEEKTDYEETNGKEEANEFEEHQKVNKKARSLSSAAFETLMTSNDEKQDCGLTQLLLAQSDLKFQEMKSASLLTLTTPGERNAFVVELFSVHDDLDELRGRDFLEAAFDCFPDLDYCAFLLPSTHPFLPFLEYFVRVPLRYNKDFSSTLYLTHRAIFSGNFQSREAVPDDLEQLAKLHSNIPINNSILRDAEEAVFDKKEKNECYVFLCDDILIGMAVMSIEKDINFLKRHYHIEDYVSIENVPFDGHGRLLDFIIMPIFAIYLRFFCREILRLSQMTILYYRLYESDTCALTRTHPLVNCLDIMIPIEPKIRTDFSFEEYFEKKLEPPEEKFSLFLMTPQFVTTSKSSEINTKIVVVGGSDCGMAFIEYLALRSKSNLGKFMNLTLISSNGLSYKMERFCKLIPFKGRYCYDYRHMKGVLRALFNIITGTVIDINRKEKYVSVQNLGNLSYDYLILTCGVQFHQPKFSKQTLDKKRENMKETRIPINCLTINDDTEAAECVKKLQNWTDNFKSQKSIVIYGKCIECYCAINAFLEMGMKGSWIILIEPCDNQEKVFFNDIEVDETIMMEIINREVKILSGWELFDWELKNDSSGNWIIKSLKIVSNSGMKEISCDILMNFSRKSVNSTTFMAFSQAGLVFDGLLVIDAENRTNDPFIFAGGTVTKYSRKYMADSVKMQNFNSIEIGEKLAKNFIKIIKSQSEGKEESIKFESDKLNSFPVFQEPKCIFCILPGGYYYLHVHKPGEKIIVDVSRKIYETVFITGSCASDIGYFRIHINSSGFVESFTCCRKKSFEIQNLIYLYGKHESLLNHLSIRFQNSLIVDFYSYFQEPWAIALFSDNFQCLQVENNAILLSKLSGGQSLKDEIMNLLIKANWRELSEEERAKIESKFIGSEYQEEIEKNVIKFLEYFENEFPMYCFPQRARKILKDFENSPLFTPE